MLDSFLNYLIVEVPEINKETASIVVDNFCSLSDQKKDRKIDEFVRVDKLNKTAESIKPRNLILNFRKLFSDIPDLAFATASSISEAWLIPFGALMLFNKIYSRMRINLNKSHAIFLLVLYNLETNENGFIEMDEFIKKLREFLKLDKKKYYSIDEINTVLNDLQRLRCILKKENHQIKLIEKIIIKG